MLNHLWHRQFQICPSPFQSSESNYNAWDVILAFAIDCFSWKLLSCSNWILDLQYQVNSLLILHYLLTASTLEYQIQLHRHRQSSFYKEKNFSHCLMPYKMSKLLSSTNWQRCLVLASAKVSTFQRPSLAKMRKSVLSSILTLLISGCALKWAFKLLSPNARATASCPSTLGTSPVTYHRGGWVQHPYSLHLQKHPCYKHEITYMDHRHQQNKSKPP